MLLPALLLPILAAAAEAPIVVTGHFWAPFISPMGEPFRAHAPGDDTLAKWFRRADRNGDGMLTAGEMQADAELFFATLDTDHDGEIDPDELTRYEWEIAPDIQVMARTRPAPGQTGSTAQQDRRDPGKDVEEFADFGSDKPRRASGKDYGLQGAARYSLLNMPEPVAAADTNFDRKVTLEEFKLAAIVRFQLLDGGHRGSLTLAQLEALLPPQRMAGQNPKKRKDAPDSRIGNPLPPGN